MQKDRVKCHKCQNWCHFCPISAEKTYDLSLRTVSIEGTALCRSSNSLCSSRTVQSAAAAALALMAAFSRNSSLSQDPERDGGGGVEVVAGRYFPFLV